MQLKCDGASFILQANTRSGGRYGVVLTIGLLVDAQGHSELPRASKRALAQQLVGEIARRLQR